MKYYIIDRKKDDEFTLGVTETKAEAIEIARDEWAHMCYEDKKKNEITVRIYEEDIEDEDCQNFDYSTVEWRLWYAVQMDSEDDWGTGFFDKDKAIEEAERIGAKQVAVIDGDICIDEIMMYDSFRVSAVFEDGTTIDNDMVYKTGDIAVEAELEEAKEWFADKNPTSYLISYYKDDECVISEEREA